MKSDEEPLWDIMRDVKGKEKQKGREKYKRNKRRKKSRRDEKQS